MSALIFNIQTDISVARENFSREEVSLIPPDTPIPPPVFTFWGRQSQWYVNKESHTAWTVGVIREVGHGILEGWDFSSAFFMLNCNDLLACLSDLLG